MAATTTLIIFGASGDLTERKLIPALYCLGCKGRLPEGFQVIGASRSPYSHDDFRDHLHQKASEYDEEVYNEADWKAFTSHIWYQPGDYTKPEAYEQLQTFLASIEGSPANRLYYLAVGPDLYIPIVECLGQMKMANEKNGWRRIVVEKPFGRDLASAEYLNKVLHGAFHENQIYRIDHYLGKETAQNILFFRFANTIFEPVWNCNYVDHVQITVAEQIDVGHRAGYYDTSGILRDMFQNHLLQLLCLVAMEPPASFKADALRNEKVKVLSSIRPIDPAKEYDSGAVRGLPADGESSARFTNGYLCCRQTACG